MKRGNERQRGREKGGMERQKDCLRVYVCARVLEREREWGSGRAGGRRMAGAPLCVRSWQGAALLFSQANCDWNTGNNNTTLCLKVTLCSCRYRSELAITGGPLSRLSICCWHFVQPKCVLIVSAMRQRCR